MILDPYYFDEVTDFTDAFGLFTFVGNSTTEKLVDPMLWQDWVINLIGDPDEIGRDAPNPYQFDVSEWREWASLFFLTQELM